MNVEVGVLVGRAVDVEVAVGVEVVRDDAYAETAATAIADFTRPAGDSSAPRTLFCTRIQT